MGADDESVGALPLGTSPTGRGLHGRQAAADRLRAVLEPHADERRSPVGTAQPTARQVAATFLDGAVLSTTRPGSPAGCLGVQGALAAGDPGRPARDTLAAWREEGTAHLRDRFRQAVAEGDLPAGADPGLLARYLMTVANGIAVQAAGGTSRDELRVVADMALHTWPPVAS